MITPTSRLLTAADAIELGITVARFRTTHAGTDRRWLRRFGYARLWHAESHRRKYGANYRWRFEQILAEAREAFRMAREVGRV